MKKLFVIILSLLLIMSLSACSEKSNQPNESNIVPDSSSQPSESENITPENINFDCSAKVPVKTPGVEPGGDGHCDLAKIYKNSNELAIESELVIKGRVEKSNYVLSSHYNVDTKSTVVIDEVYKGELKPGDRISVIESGGIIPKGIYSNAISMEKFGTEASDKDDTTLIDVRFDGYKVMEEGEKVVLFLIKITRSDVEDFKVGCYECRGIWQGKLLYNEEIDSYAPYIPEANKADVEAKIYKENQLNSIVKDTAVKAS